MLEQIFIISAVIFVCVTLLFLLSIKLQDNSIVDLFWGVGFVLIALLSYILFSDYASSQMIVSLLVTAWGVRLFLNILAKKLPHWGDEDPRYARWRKSWKYFYTRSFFQVYLLQGFLMLLVSIPIVLVNISNNILENNFVLFFGALVAFLGLLYEARADGELAGFVKNKKSGDILTSGLRSFHRYPQYFGESVFWLGVSIIALQVSFWGLLGWIIITILVRYVSGVPLLEERYKGQKNYEEYSKETSIFFPNFFKK